VLFHTFDGMQVYKYNYSELYIGRFLLSILTNAHSIRFSTTLLHETTSHQNNLAEVKLCRYKKKFCIALEQERIIVGVCIT